MIQGFEPAYVSFLAAGMGIALGIFVLARHPDRGLNRVFFAFMMASGMASLVSGLSRFNPGTELSLVLQRVYWYFDPWIAALVILLALHFPTRSGIALRRPVLTHAAVLVPPTVLCVAFALDPALLIRPALLDGVAYYTLAPLGLGMVLVRAVAVGVALFVVAARLRRTPHALQRTQLAWLQAALIVAFIPKFGLFATRQFAVNPDAPAVVGFVVSTILVNVLAVWSMRPWNGSLLNDPDRQVILVSYASSGAAAIAVGVLGTQSAVDAFLAFLMLVYPLMLTYAALKFDLFGLDVRLRQFAPNLTLGVTLIGTFALLLGLAANLSPAQNAANHVLAASVLTAAAAVPLRSATTRLATRLGWTRGRDPAALAERRLEIYRAAVENAVTRGEEVDENDALVDLRDRLALSTRDHRVMVQVVRDAQHAAPKSPRGPLREGDLVLRKYLVERFLGSGSFGRAVLATQTSVGRKVVIKEPHELFRSRGALNALSKEARLAARVNHPNVVTLLDFEELEETGYLVFEYVAGGSLEQRMRDGALPRAEAYAVFRDMLLGLDAIHRARVVHMDLKPANILLDEEGRAKITDFGIAREVRMDVAATLGRTVGPQAHPGTLLYMAPEQVRGRRDPGPAADLYAAGAILHEMLTGKRYLDFPESPPLIQDAILYKEPALDDPRLTPHEQDLLAALLAKAPADRPRTARDVLDRLPSGTEAAARPVAHPTFAPEPTREA